MTRRSTPSAAPATRLWKTAAPHTLTGVFLSVLPGPATATDEAVQSIQLSVTVDSGLAVLKSAPSIYELTSGQPTTAQITLESAANANGNVTLLILVRDDGGTERGGVDFTIASVIVEIEPTNDPPDFLVNIATVDVLEDSGPATFNGVIVVTSSEVLEVLSLSSVLTGSAYFFKAPNLTLTGVLTFEPYPNAFGTATLDVTITDNAVPPLSSAAKRININILAVNDAPSFAIPTSLRVSECASATCPVTTVTSFASNISAGPSNEAAQGLTFSVSIPYASQFLFAAAPTLSPTTGTLAYQLRSGANTGDLGVQTITVYLRDNGGTLNGGTDVSAHSFDFTVEAPTLPPTFTVSSATIVCYEDAGAVVMPDFISQIYYNGLALTGFRFSVEVTNLPLFTSAPNISRASESSTAAPLAFTLAPDQYGTAAISIRLYHPTLNQTSETQSVELTVVPVNDPPTFDLSDVTLLEGSGTSTVLVLFNVSVGNNEVQSIAAVTVTCLTGTSMFSVLPTITNTGYLRIELKSTVREGTSTCRSERHGLRR